MSTTSEGEAIPWMPDEVAPAAASAGRASTRQGGVAWVWFRRALKASFAAGVVYYLAAYAPLADILAALLRVHLGWLLLALAFVPLSAWVIAARQKVLTDWQGLSLSVRQIMAINLSTRYYDLLLPGYVSGVTVRWPRMARHDGKPVEALAAIVFNRYTEVLTTLVLSLVFWVLGRPAALSQPGATTAILLVLGGLITLQVSLLDARVMRAWCRILETGGGRVLPAGLRTKAAGLLRALGSFRGLPPPAVRWLAALSAIRGLTIISSFVLMAWALHIELSFVEAGWVRAMLKLAAFIPVSVMGVGIREVGVVVLLQLYGVTSADALALSVLLVGRNLAKAVGGGALELRHALFAQTPTHEPRR